MQARCNLRAIAHLPEAEHLVRAMLAAAPKRRPGAEAVMAHPFFWSHTRQLAFLVALSDRVECEDREVRARRGALTEPLRCLPAGQGRLIALCARAPASLPGVASPIA